MQNNNLKISSLDIGNRIDKILKSYFIDISRNSIIKLIKSEKVKFNNKIIISPSYIIKEIGVIKIEKHKEKSKKNLKQNLNVLFEDEHLIILNKQAGILTHCSEFNKNTSLVDLLLENNKKLEYKKNTNRVGVVHRLDKDTTGVIIFSKTNEAGKILSEYFKNRKIKKTYDAIVWGRPKLKYGTINLPISSIINKKKISFSSNAKDALTVYKVLKSFENSFSHIECNLLTGRTHQLRVHLLSLGCPIVGDYLYSKGRNAPKNLAKNILSKINNFKRQALHAKEIEFPHPINKKIINLKAKKPNDLINLEKVLFEKI